MDFSFTEEQTQIRELANQILRENSDDEANAAFAKTDELYSQPLWQLFAEAGLLGMAVPEDFGGSGFGFAEICQMLEEQGRFVAPIPLLPSLVLGGLPIATWGSAELKEKYLSALAAGEAILTGAIAEESMVEAMRPVCNAVQAGDSWQLTGERLCVPYAAQAAAIVVAADTEQGPALFVVDAAAGFSSEYVDSTNREPLYHVNFNNTQATYLGDAQAVQLLVEYACVAAAASMIGVTEEAVRRTAEYTSERKQFGTSIASFQNTTMKLADAYIDIECLRSSYFEAMWKLANNMPATAEAQTAKYWAAIAGHRITHTCQHLHGGIGADVEYPLHRYYLWFKQLEQSIGGATKQLADLGALLAADSSLNLLPEAAA